MTDRMLFSRRSLLKGSTQIAGTAALLSAARLAIPGGAWAAGADTPETTKAILGFIALTDAAALIIAKEKGFFEKYGMPDVQVNKQASWGATRDNIELGSANGGIDGAHILTPMPYLISTGKVTKNNVPVPMFILARLNTDGQGISVSKRYLGMNVTVDASPLKAVFADAKKAGKELKCAMTFPGGTHDMWIRYWLAAGGIDPDRDISTIVVPPPQMVANMKVDTMEAFCVCEPWNEQLIHQKIGFTAATTGELWNGHPEKALGMRADWVEKHPKAAKALLMAVMEAQMWCEKAENKDEMCTIIAKREWFKVPKEDITERAKGDWDYGDGRVVKNSKHILKYWRDHASYPFQSHDAWFLAENIRWGYQPENIDFKALISAVNREDLWRDAAKSLGVTDLPASTSRGKETFFDGKVFDPDQIETYIASLDIRRV